MNCVLFVSVQCACSSVVKNKIPEYKLYSVRDYTLVIYTVQTSNGVQCAHIRHRYPPIGMLLITDFSPEH